MTSDKSYAVEARLNRLVGDGWAVPLISWKAANESRSNNATPAQDTDLTITVPATATSARFEVCALLGYEAGATGNFRWMFEVAGGTMRYSSVYNPAGGGVSGGGWYHGGTQYIAAGQGAGVEASVEIARGWWTVPAAGGDFYLKWAQGTSNATATILYAGSYLAVRKIDE